MLTFALPEEERRLVLSEQEAGILTLNANTRCLLAAEDLTRAMSIPRWASLVTMQLSLAGALAAGAHILGRRTELRVFMRSVGEHACVDIEDHAAVVKSATALERSFRSYLAGEVVQ